MPKNIELELRAIIKKEDFDPAYKKLKKIGKLVSETDRLSVMFYGTCEKNTFDAKVRITNGASEVVIKKGDYHSPDRTEYSQNISNGEFINMVRIFSQFGFGSKVFERTSFNFQFPDSIMITLAKAGEYSYLEIEKMTDKRNQNADKKTLQNIAYDLGVLIVENKKTYYDFCSMLTEKVDWVFHGTKKDFAKLKRLLKQKISR